MIWRPYGRDIEVGPDLFERLSNKLSIKSSWTSIALQTTELWCSQWFTISLPTNQKFNFTFVPTIKDWHVQVEPSELYQKLLCKYRNELTLYLTIMVIFISVMSSSLWAYIRKGKRWEPVWAASQNSLCFVHVHCVSTRKKLASVCDKHSWERGSDSYQKED